MEKYVYLETYGCSANQNNSEILAGILRSAGYQITNNEKIADIIILNTCVVKSKTESKIKRKIQDISENKQTKNKLLIITGCMPETDAKQIKQLNPNAILLGTHHFKDILKLIRNYNDSQLDLIKQNDFLDYKNEQKVLLPKISNNKLISITQISEGCLGACNFCKARLAKGKLFSYNIEDIVKSIENDLQQGAKEIWITSQDNANYGMDKDDKKQKLPELLNKILNLNHRFKLRLGMMDPNNVLPILDRLIEIYKNKKIYKFLHIPIQSASNKILKDMNRLYNIEEVENIINKFRKQFPDITIATDIIVGYPTEQESDHIKNISFIKKFKPPVFNLSKMSIHKETEIWKRIEKGKLKLQELKIPDSAQKSKFLTPQETEGVLGKGTAVEKLKPLSINIINKRASELMNLHRQTALESKQKFLNKIISVFVNKKLEGNLYESRDENYNIILINTDDKSILGKKINVKIKQAGVHHMIGEII